MEKKYSDSLFPWGIGSSFVITLFFLISVGTIVGYVLKDTHNVKQGGVVTLLIIFLILLVIPMQYNKLKSRFERETPALDTFDGLGTVQGLRGAPFRVLLYENGFEIRSFYHRYYIPFDQIEHITVDNRRFDTKFHFVTNIPGMPDYITSSGNQFLSMAMEIEERAGG